ncbi:MAG: RMD1 family protein [Pseudomonadota bacterium]
MSDDFILDFALSTDYIHHLSLNNRLHVKAFLVGDQLAVRPLSSKKRSSQSAVMLGMPNQRVAFLFGYGVMVVFSAYPIHDEVRCIELCRPYVLGQQPNEFQTESLEVQLNSASDGFSSSACALTTVTRERLELIAEVMARSLILDKHESVIATRFEQVKPIANSIIQGKIHEDRENLLKYIGLNLLTEHELAGRVEITEKPSLLWDNGSLEPLYFQLMDEFEIVERQNTINRKLEVISRTAQTYLDVSMHQHDLRLEWYIIILIFIEIVLEVYTIFMLSGH